MATRIALMPHRVDLLEDYGMINLFVYLDNGLDRDPHEQIVRTLQLGETELPWLLDKHSMLDRSSGACWGSHSSTGTVHHVLAWWRGKRRQCIGPESLLR